MASEIKKLGPGILKFGEVGAPKEFSGRVTECAVEPKSATGEKTQLLDGSVYIEPSQFEGELTGEFFQDYDLDGLVAWTWENDGAVMDFIFKPRNDGEIQVKGKCQIQAVNIGGKTGEAAKTKFSFPIAEKPTVKNQD